jgi:hypothetical protein
MSETRDDDRLAAQYRPDFDRFRRKGVPEVILADRKTEEQCLAIAGAFLQHSGRAILSRVGTTLRRRLEGAFAGEAACEWREAARAVVLRGPGFHLPLSGGRVGVVTAGTSDLPVAEEAALLACEMGCEVGTAVDVGVAGLHRLFEPLHKFQEELRADVLIVASGMDGALPSVVAGLVDVPVVGLPTSIGYGLGGDGVAALYSMLQSCSPGLCMVNIDNGIGAGAVAGLIANRMAAARRGALP